jgi:nicotinate-nucleotide pyrophosphorylase (carboxylating)
MMASMSFQNCETLIDLALAEDLGAGGDVTSQAVFVDETVDAVLVSKDTGVLAGIEVFRRVFEKVDSNIMIEFLRSDGDALASGDTVAHVRGKTISVLSAERTAINFLAFLSGIATETSKFVSEASAGGRAVILDTRKTLPGYRELSKYAVRVGGGRNHRMGLHDMVMLKDNHIDRCGSISSAVHRVREKWGSMYRVEVECRTAVEVGEALDSGVDVIMLDNMDFDQMKSAVRLCDGRSETEASGNMELDRIRAVSSIVVDYISVGKLTHTVRAFDFSLKVRA